MMNSSANKFGFMLAVSFLVSACWAGGGPEIILDPANAAAVKQEIGTSLTAKPKQPRRVLVFFKVEGYCHGDSIALGNEVFRVAAEKTHAFQVDFSEDYAAFDAKNLARYDAIVLNNTTMLKTLQHPELVPNLIAFVKSGKGLTVIHAGADCFYQADDASYMIGGRFSGHPWFAGKTEWAFKIEDPKSPLCACFPAATYKAKDEIYMQASPFYDRSKLHVLVSLDLSDAATAQARDKGKKQKAWHMRADNDFAVSWIRPYGKGRVFYTSFAHNTVAWLSPVTLRHILDGLQYTLGDLAADDAPAAAR